MSTGLVRVLQEPLHRFQRLLSFLEATFKGVEGVGSGNELVLELSGVHRFGLVGHVDECAEFLSDQPGDPCSHREAERLAVPPPGRPRGIWQRNPHRPGSDVVSELGEDPPVDLGESSTVKSHHVTSMVNQLTGGNLLQMRV